MGADTQLKIDRFTQIFHLLLFWKIFYGCAKVILAILLLTSAQGELVGLFYKLTAHELVEDPNDVLLHVARPVILHLSGGTKTFVALYLLFWGIVDDMFLSANILRHQLWAYPAALMLIASFVPYEMYHFIHTHSMLLACIIAMDILIFFMIAREYKKMKKAVARQ